MLRESKNFPLRSKDLFSGENLAHAILQRVRKNVRAKPSSLSGVTALWLLALVELGQTVHLFPINEQFIKPTQLDGESSAPTFPGVV